MNPEKPKAVLFDLDDTIIAFEAVNEQCWQEVCRRFASRIIGLEANQLHAAIIKTRTWYLSDAERHRLIRLDPIPHRREMVALSLAGLGINAPELANELADSYGVEREIASFVLPGAVDVLKHLRLHDFRLALITNGASETQRKKIERFALSPFFDYILVEEEFGAGKPDGKVFLYALEKLGVGVAGARMVGDDLERDIGGAQDVGIPGIWVDWRSVGLPSGSKVNPDRIIKTISVLK